MITELAQKLEFPQEAIDELNVALDRVVASGLAATSKKTISAV